MMHKIIHQQIAIPLPEYFKPRGRSTRSQHQHRFTRLSTSSDSYKFSFFPRTMKDWDALPTNPIEHTSRGAVQGSHQHWVVHFHQHPVCNAPRAHTQSFVTHIILALNHDVANRGRRMHPCLDAEQALTKISIRLDVDVEVALIVR